MPKFQISSLFLIFTFLSSAHSLYFLLDSGQEKCVFDDIPKSQLVIGYFELKDPLEAEKFVQIKVYNPRSETLLTRDAQGKGKFSLTTQDSGHHRFCMRLADSRSKVMKVRFSFRLVIGEEETKISDAAKNDHITQLFAQAKRLLENTRHFISLQEMNRESEDTLYEENTRINERVVLATIFQTIVILASGIFQILSLRKFFIARKLY